MWEYEDHCQHRRILDEQTKADLQVQQAEPDSIAQCLQSAVLKTRRQRKIITPDDTP